MDTMKPHKHAALIKAWADGEVIQRYSADEWQDLLSPSWHVDAIYRIKPKQDIVKTFMLEGHFLGGLRFSCWDGGFVDSDQQFISVTFDAETAKIKGVKIL